MALFSRMAYPAVAPAGISRAGSANLAAQAGEAPLFILPPVAVSAAGATGGSAASDTVSGMPAENGPAPFVRVGDAAVPATQDAASLVADLGTGMVFASTNADRRWPTASIAKLMSASIVSDKIDLNAKISITDQMFSADPSEPVLAVGATYTAGDLLHLMLLPSSNVAAEAVAAFYGRDAFIKEMNARAAAWGMADTYFNDPSGISASDQSTVNDLLKLARKIYADYPNLFTITRTPQATITEVNSGQKTIIKSINQFAGGSTFIGGKTGHTQQAAGNLLSVFRYRNRPVVIIVLGTDERFNDTQTLYDWFKANFR